MSHTSVANLTHVGRDVPNVVAHPLIITRIMRKVVIQKNGCWEWHGPVNHKGYGFNTYKGQSEAVHRVMYRCTKGNGEIPDGMFVCHHCDNRRCVNPEHLWIGTNNDNVQDMRLKKRGNAQKKTICKRGHPLSGENLGVRGPRQHRFCKTCDFIAKRMKLGWTFEQASTIPKQKPGYRVVNVRQRLQSTENESG